MTSDNSGFSERYLNHVLAERQYLLQTLEEAVRSDRAGNGKKAAQLALDLSSPPRTKPLLSLEEAYRSIRAENRRKI